jgi:hypothetical protein
MTDQSSHDAGQVIQFPRAVPRPATQAEVAALEFGRDLNPAVATAKIRREHVRSLADYVCETAEVAAALIAMDKSEVVEKVAGCTETFDRSLTEFEEAAGHARALLEIIENGQARIIIALATIDTHAPKRRPRR